MRRRYAPIFAGETFRLSDSKGANPAKPSFIGKRLAGRKGWWCRNPATKESRTGQIPWARTRGQRSARSQRHDHQS